MKWPPAVNVRVIGKDSEPKDAVIDMEKIKVEAAFILSIPTKERRIAFLDNAEKKRGLAVRAALEFEVMALWKQRRDAAKIK